MSYSLLAFTLCVGLFWGMLILFEVGRRLGLRQFKRDPEGAHKGIQTVETAILGLLGLFIAFTFSGASDRFDRRRTLIVDEANAIGTAYLRIDLFSADAQPELRDSFRRYVDSRLEIYRKFPDLAAVRKALAHGEQLQKQVWNASIAASQVGDTHDDAAKLLLPALNNMFDITTERTAALHFHPPTIIYVMLFALALVSALLTGYGTARAAGRHWIHATCLAGVLAVSVFVILDLEHPRYGLIRVTDFDQLLVDLRNTMK